MTIAIVFLTIVAGIAAAAYFIRPEPYRRARIKYDLDFAQEFWGDAELYLAVEASSTPGVRAVFPLNVANPPNLHGYFDLPFELAPGDSLTFTLWDDDRLTAKEEKLLVGAAESTGFVLYAAGKVLAARNGVPLPREGDVAVKVLLQTVAKAVILQCKQHPFEDYGHATYVVPDSFPSNSMKVNPLTVAENFFGVKVARLSVKVFYREQQ